MAFGTSVFDKLALAEDRRASSDEQDEAQGLLLKQRAIRRGQQARVNDPIKQLQAKTSTMTQTPWETPNADENAEFWGNNARLGQIVSNAGGGVSRPEGANLRGHVATIGGGGMGAFDNLRGMSTYGNINTGPSSLERDMGAEALQSMRLQNHEMSRSPEERRDTGVADLLAKGRAEMGLEQELTKARAHTFYDPWVEAQRENQTQNAVDTLTARYVEPARLKAEADAEVASIKGRYGTQQQQARNAQAMIGMILSGMGRAATTTGFTPEQKQMLQALYDQLHAMGADAEMWPKGLVPAAPGMPGATK